MKNAIVKGKIFVARVVIAILLAVTMFTTSLAFQNVAPAFAKDCDVNAGVQQCCSAANCGGKVLNNRDLHNCKGSGGKSWTDGKGYCTRV